MNEQIPGGWIEGPRFKGEGKYLTSPVWCGDKVPEWYMGHPWGFGGECWFVTAYEADPKRPGEWVTRQTFAAVDATDALAGARAWAAAGFPDE